MRARILFITVIPWVYFWSVLPFSVLHALSSFTAFLLYRVFNYRRNLVESNIQKAFPNYNRAQIAATTQAFFRHFTDLLIEIVKGITLSNKALKRRFEITNIQEIECLLQEHKSVIVMAPHLNNWEWTASLSLYTRYPFYAIYQPLNNVHFDAFMRKNRGRTGLHLLPTYHTKETIAQHQRDGHLAIYGFLSDQSPTLKKTKLWAHFFGRLVPVHTGAEELAREHNMAVVYMHLEKVKRSHYKAKFRLITKEAAKEPPFQITRNFLLLTEQSIKQQPQNYLWTHRRFKHERSDSERV